MKSIVFILGVIFCGSAVQANDDALYTESLKQENWTVVEMGSENVIGGSFGNGFLTSEGRFRLNELNYEIPLKAKIDSETFNKKDKGQINQYCLLRKKAPHLIEGDKTLQRISLWLPLLGTGETNWGLVRNGKIHEGSAPAQQLLKIKSLTLKASFLPESATARTKVNETQVKSELNQSFEEVRQGLLNNGEAQLTIVGRQDLICDLLSGEGSLSVTAVYEFQNAKIQRTPFVSPRDVLGMSESLKSIDVSNLSAEDRRQVFAVALGYDIGINRQLTPTGIGPFRLLRLIRGLIQPNTGTLKNLSNFDIENVANSLDTLAVTLNRNESRFVIKEYKVGRP